VTEPHRNARPCGGGGCWCCAAYTGRHTPGEYLWYRHHEPPGPPVLLCALCCARWRLDAGTTMPPDRITSRGPEPGWLPAQTCLAGWEHWWVHHHDDLPAAHGCPAIMAAAP
jgi:hypothetical protein